MIKLLKFHLIIILTSFLIFQFGCDLTNSTDNEKDNEPSEIIKIDGFTYANYNGVWYTYINGQKGDLVDLEHIIVRLISGADITNFDFSAVGLPEMTVNRIISGGYFELNIPVDLDPFDVAQTLWATGEFETVHFNIIIKVEK